MKKITVAGLALVFSLSPLAVLGQAIENVLPKQAAERLESPNTYLVDVRSVAEYVFVGHPPKAVNMPLAFWSETEQKLTPNERFVQDLKSRFRTGDTLFFICRSGGRSLRAAQAARAAGFTSVVNVSEGFEGAKDAQGRHTVGGWRGAGLPYTLDVDPTLAYKPGPEKKMAMHKPLRPVVIEKARVETR